jgi:hypothetical protein
LRLWREAHPPGFTPDLEAELLESFNRNARFWVRHLKADGYQHRDGFRYARERFLGGLDGVYGPESMDVQAPWIVAEPEVRRVLGTVFGGDGAGAPRHVSDVMPTWASFDARELGPRRAVLLHARRPNAQQQSRRGCDGLQRACVRAEPVLCVAVYVEGRSQNAHFAMVDNVGSKTAYLSYSDGRPSIGRWHTSAQFDVAEGFYAGRTRTGRAAPTSRRSSRTETRWRCGMSASRR